MKRYDPSLAAKKYDEIMIECVNGEWVRYEEVYRLRQLLDACEPYLKEGETPAECIERNRRDAARMTLRWQERGERMKKIYEVLRCCMKRETISIPEWNELVGWFTPKGEPL